MELASKAQGRTSPPSQLTSSVSERSSSSEESILEIIRQGFVSEETLTQNGHQKVFSVVVKNSPFVVEVRQSRLCYDLNRVAFSCSLLYDTEAQKVVDFVNHKPMEFKAKHSQSGESVEIEIRIKIGSRLGRVSVRIQGNDPMTGAPYPNLHATTKSIKVISKPEKLRKNNINPKKRTLNDMMVDSINRIEQQQATHTRLLEQIVVSAGQGSKSGCGSCEHRRQEHLSELADREQVFKEHFKWMLTAYGELEPDQRPQCVSSLIRGCTLSEREMASELLDMMLTEGFHKELGCPSSCLPPQLTVDDDYFAYSVGESMFLDR